MTRRPRENFGKWIEFVTLRVKVIEEKSLGTKPEVLRVASLQLESHGHGARRGPGGHGAESHHWHCNLALKADSNISILFCM